MTTQFPGESNWDAIVNDNSLDIVEEDAFEKFITDRGHSKTEALETLERLLASWEGVGGG